jgi:hypothetical protein
MYFGEINPTKMHSRAGEGDLELFFDFVIEANKETKEGHRRWFVLN